MKEASAPTPCVGPPIEPHAGLPATESENAVTVTVGSFQATAQQSSDPACTELSSEPEFVPGCSCVVVAEVEGQILLMRPPATIAVEALMATAPRDGHDAEFMAVQFIVDRPAAVLTR